MNDTELMDSWNALEARKRDLKRIRTKAVARTLPGIYAMIQRRIATLVTEQENIFSRPQSPRVPRYFR